ncbi:predicted protein [Naegleria gruberi]|uniref:Predicted protein n=1 Tax=Naegleria gruberi TaxID=5762 RepID=D2VMK3_NAEGR|nr:uncharacterized protein NAEGRDRAFT_50790 [Naegleria gruberi]EFC42079.1 predicted protein [Naegleria gruberi]|eukprot:XP_002674823.1 predicted protein [Naegleria gruberi strain NEG-M]
MPSLLGSLKTRSQSRLLEDEEDEDLEEELDDIVLSSSHHHHHEEEQDEDSHHTKKEKSPTINGSKSSSPSTTAAAHDVDSTITPKKNNDSDDEEPIENTPAFKDDRSKLRVRFGNVNKEEEAQDLETPPLPKRKQILVSKGSLTSTNGNANTTSSSNSLGSDLNHHHEPSLSEEEEENEKDYDEHRKVKLTNHNEHKEMKNVNLEDGDDVEVEITNTTKISMEDDYDRELLYYDNHIDDTYNDYLKPNAIDENPVSATGIAKLFKSFPRISFTQFMWLMKLGFRQTPLVFFGIIFLIVSTGLSLFLPIYVGEIINTIPAGTTGKEYINQMALIILGVVAGIGLTTALRNFCFTYAGERAVARLRKDLFNSIIVQEVGFFDITKTGELLNRLSSDTKSLENAVTVNLSMFLRYVAQLIGGIVFLLIISWKLTLIMLAVIPPLVFISLIYAKYIKNITRRTQDALANSTDVAEESFSNLRTVRSFAKETKHISLYSAAIDLTLSLARKFSFANGIFSGGMMFAGNASIILVLWFGGRLVVDGEITVGSLISFIMYTLLVAASFGVLSGLLVELFRALEATVRVYNLLQRIPAIERRNPNVMESDTRELPKLNGHIVLHDVSFAYPSRTEHSVLNKINLEMSPSSILALVGRPGQGKTTIVSLLQRFYDPNDGQITLDGVPLTQIDPVWLRKNIGLLTQDPAMFSASIRENICYGWTGDEAPTDEQVMEASKKANVHEFISNFKDGYDTIIGERGVRLSASERQRIAIARILLKDPKILILDEYSHSLEVQYDSQVQQALNSLMNGRTVIVIAHKLATVIKANKVCVIEEGSVVEQGEHFNLLQKGGLYKQVVERQLVGTD